MTVLQKPVKRELPISFDRRQWVATLHPYGIEIKAKRTRGNSTYTILWETIISKAIEIRVARERREKKEKRVGLRRQL